MLIKGSPVRLLKPLSARLAFIILALQACSDKEVVKPTYWEDPQRIPCEACIPFEGYFSLRDVSAGTVNGAPVWMPLPANTIRGKIFSGYLMLNTFSELTLNLAGEIFDPQALTIVPFSSTEFYNYHILTDSTMTIGPDAEPGRFFPFLGPETSRIDTIIWERFRYVRQ